MAGKTSDGAEAKTLKAPRILPLLQKACFAAALIVMIVLFVGAYDFGFMDLRSAMSMFAAPLLLVLIITASIGALASMKTTAGEKLASEQRYTELQAGIEARAQAIDHKVDEFLGEEFKRIKSENEQFKADFEEMKQTEREKLEEENNFLKEQNSILKEQITTNNPAPTQPKENGEQLTVAEDLPRQAM